MIGIEVKIDSKGTLAVLNSLEQSDHEEALASIGQLLKSRAMENIMARSGPDGAWPTSFFSGLSGSKAIWADIMRSLTYEVDVDKGTVAITQVSADAGLMTAFKAIPGMDQSRLRLHEDAVQYQELHHVSYPVAIDAVSAGASGPDDRITAMKAAPGVDQTRLQLHEAALAYQNKYPGMSYSGAIAAVSAGASGPDDHITTMKTLPGVDQTRLQLHNAAIAYQQEHPGVSYFDAVIAVQQQARANA